ncbi:MAG: hypothetical protein VX899_15110 [Myxococcota bacterium]|nr:hypothetical protein [Myxococcota bacterium]
MSEHELSRLDALLMRVLDGQASQAERQELLALADAEPLLADHRALREALRAAVADQSADPIDVVPQVLAALQVGDPWAEIASGLRDAVDAEVDLADGIMAAISAEAPQAQAVETPAADELGILLSAMVDGELSREQRKEMADRLANDPDALDAMTHHAELGRMVRMAVEDRTHRDELHSLWTDICPEIGVEDPEHVPGWEQTAVALREAVLERAALSPSEEGALTAAILNGLPHQEHQTAVEDDDSELEPANQGPWGVLMDPRTVALAVAALVLLAIGTQLYPQLSAPESAPIQGTDAVAELVEPTAPEGQVAFTDHNEAWTETIESGNDVTVNVIPAMEGAPMFLMIDEGDEGAAL